MRLKGVLVTVAILLALVIVAACNIEQEPSTPQRSELGAKKSTVVKKEAEPPPFDTNDPAMSLREIYQFYQYLKEFDPKKAAAWLECVLVTRPEFKSDDQFERALLDAVAKEANGKSYLRKVGEEGLTVTNTGYQNGRASYLTMRLKPGDYYLVNESGEPWFRSACKNPLGAPNRNTKKVINRVKKFRRPKLIAKVPRNKFPETTPHHPGNPSTQPPQVNPGGNTGPTPGYLGNAEQVIGIQDNAPRGQTEPTQMGTPGSGTAPGNTTPLGTDASPPTNEPVSTPDTGKVIEGTVPKPN